MTQSTSDGVDTLDFRDAMARWASGVAVVSLRDEQGLAATTVSSFNSLALEPPLVVVALSDRSRTLKRVETAGRFTVSVLSSAQRDIAMRCAKGEARDADFDEGVFARDSLAGLSSTLADAHRHGDHTLLVGRVTSVRRGGEQEPLLYWNRAYRAVTELPPAGTENVPK